MEILAVQLKRIGDLILTTPALTRLRERNPQARITLVIEEGCQTLVPALAMVDHVWVYKRRQGNWKIWSKLITRHWDQTFDFTSTDRSALMTFCSKAAVRKAFSRAGRKTHRRWIYNSYVDSPVRNRHTVDHHLDLVTEPGEGSESAAPGLVLPEWCEKKSGQLLESVHLSSPYFIVHPGTARLEKYWQPLAWAEVIAKLREKTGLPALVTGGPDPVEQEHARKIESAFGEPLPLLVGKLDLLTLAALIKKSTFFLGVDSAPMHLAACMETPTVALFGPTNPFHWRPRHAAARVLLAGEEGPMTEFSPRSPRRDLSLITPEQVVRAAESLLHSNPSSSHGG